MSGDPPDYYAYLIRLWRTGLEGPWRASLEDAKTGDRIGFSGLSEACAYLLAKTQLTAKASAVGGALEGGEEA